MKIKHLEKDGFDAYSLIYPAHKRTILYGDLYNSSPIVYHLDDIYFLVLMRQGYLQALFAYLKHKTSFYALSGTAEFCLPHYVYRKKDISLNDVIDLFFVSRFYDNLNLIRDLKGKNRFSSSAGRSNFSFPERENNFFPRFSLRELFNHA